MMETAWGKAILYQFVGGTDGPSTVEGVAEIAKAVAKLNTITNWESIQRKSTYNLAAFEQLVEDFSTSPYQYPEVYRHFEKSVKRMAEIHWPDLPVGLVHHDVFPDNSLFQGNQLQALIDFECACTDTLMLDVGMTIYGFCFVEDQLDETLLEAFLTAYESERKLSALEKEMVHPYIFRSALTWNYWHLNYVVKDNDLKKLERAKFHQRRIDLMEGR